MEMEERYKEEIRYSVEQTRIFSIFTNSVESKCIRHTSSRQISIMDADSVTAMCNKGSAESSKVCILNFASYKNPGGRFIAGSRAQEESLCHESFLYNVLKEQPKYYEWNNAHKNRALYLNRALYSPNIRFCTKGNVRYSDVLTCAAPNKRAAQRFCHVSSRDNSEVLRSRIEFVLGIAEQKHVDVLILGAYGCGVFGQNPFEVATIFKEFLTGSDIRFAGDVVFAIPGGDNLAAFQSVF